MGKNFTTVTALAPPTDAPAGVTFPYGRFQFTLNNVVAGETVSMDIFVPLNTTINSYMKKGNDDVWSDISTHIEHGVTKTKITISLTEGGNFDTDGVNTTITDPGGPAAKAALANVNAIPTLSEWMLILLSSMLGFFAVLKMKGHREM